MNLNVNKYNLILTSKNRFKVVYKVFAIKADLKVHSDKSLLYDLKVFFNIIILLASYTSIHTDQTRYVLLRIRLFMTITLPVLVRISRINQDIYVVLNPFEKSTSAGIRHPG